MVIAKCVNCGKEYELEEDENPAAYECECGADLHSKGQKNLFANMYTVVEEGLGSVSSETKKQRESFKQNQAKQKEQAEIRRKKRAEMWRKKQEKRKKEKKEEHNLIHCVDCGHEISRKATECPNCGRPTEAKKTSRTIELVLGILGGIFGLLGGVFGLFIGMWSSDIFMLGVSAISASVMGIVCAVVVRENHIIGGMGLLVCAVWLIISISAYGVIGSVLFGIGGLIALLRK